MATQKVLTDIPESEVHEVIEDFQSEGCTNVTREKQPNGRWTVRALCPDPARGERSAADQQGDL